MNMSAGWPGGSSVYFEFADCQIQLDTLPVNHLQWLREFLTPAFSLQHAPANKPVGNNIPRISLRIDPKLYRKLLVTGPDGCKVDTFLLDSGIVKLPAWRHDGAGILAFDESTLVFYRVNGHHITVISEVDRPAVRIALMRVMRELTSNHALDRGALQLHAAAFSVDGRAVIIAGPKRAGKTTLLLQALQSGFAEYIGNDRVIISATENSFVVRGVPTIVSIRAATLSLVPVIAARLMKHPYHFRKTLDEVYDATQTTRPPNTKLQQRSSVTPGQLCDLINANSLPQARASLILFLRLDGTRTRPQQTKLGHDALVTQLNANLLCSTDPTLRSKLFRWPQPVVTSTSPNLIQTMSSIPACVFQPATGENSTSANLAAIVELLGQSS